MKKTLVVLAAGMGSRFGGLKQIEPVGPNGEFIIDYSIKDAIMAGFDKVVFVIKEENYGIFKETIGKRIEDKIKVEYAFQKNDDIPSGVVIPNDRVKPLGTGHALYAVRDIVKENFATINADDFYGRDAYLKAAKFLEECKSNEYGMIAYKVGNTLTNNGAVKRGVVFENNGNLHRIVESSIEEENGLAKATPLDGSETFFTSLEQPVSMNLFCLTPKLLTYICDNIKSFFQDEKNDLNSCEYLLPNIVFESSIIEKEPIKVITTDSKYLGMTYKEDLEDLKKGIQKEIEIGNYAENLWEE
ncbi:MAG: nucleotidyltransferase [Firmicutes bacterium]|nr:nucleotidyltransferase [Bacillota bacterium]